MYSNTRDFIWTDWAGLLCIKDTSYLLSIHLIGTTWTQEIMSCVLHDGNLKNVNTRHTMKRVPFLEMNFGGSVHSDVII